MSFPDAITTVFRKYAEFTGRATRSELWWWLLFTTLVSAALGAFNFVTPQGIISIGSTLASVWSIAVLVPTLAVGVRRLRDAGREWQEILWILLPLAGIIVLVFRWCEPSKPAVTTAEVA